MTTYENIAHEWSLLIYGLFAGVTLLSLYFGYIYSCRLALKHLPLAYARRVITYAARHQMILLTISYLLMVIFVWFRPEHISEGAVLTAATPVFTIVNKLANVNKKVEKRFVRPYLADEALYAAIKSRLQK